MKTTKPGKLRAAKAMKTEKWAATMTKWLVTKAGCSPQWQLVSFSGPGGRESAGIVDLLAVRKDHKTPRAGFKRGDLFEIVLMQIKGGSAPWPSVEDNYRLKNVARYYHAKAVVLAIWTKGRQPTFYRLKRRLPGEFKRKDAWEELVDVAEVFG